VEIIPTVRKDRYNSQNWWKGERRFGRKTQGAREVLACGKEDVLRKCLYSNDSMTGGEE
jgi:hypothetical protein